MSVSQRSCQREVGVGFLSLASSVLESKTPTVETAEEGPRNDNCHIVAVALDIDPWSFRKK